MHFNYLVSLFCTFNELTNETDEHKTDVQKKKNIVSTAPTTVSLQRTPRSLIEHNSLLQTVTSWTDNKFSPGKFSTPSTSSASDLTSPSSASSGASLISPSTSSFSLKRDKRNVKVLGPHCEQFLGKIFYSKSKKILAKRVQ